MSQERPDATDPAAAPATARAVADRAATAYRALADLAETVEDEWQYVNDLVEAYLPSIGALGERHAATEDEPLPADRAAAVDEAIAEIGLITDAHRAIDWLSTFPHVVALALDGDVDAPVAQPQPETPTATGYDDDEEDGGDNPFAALLRGSRR